MSRFFGGGGGRGQLQHEVIKAGYKRKPPEKEQRTTKYRELRTKRLENRRETKKPKLVRQAPATLAI